MRWRARCCPCGKEGSWASPQVSSQPRVVSGASGRRIAARNALSAAHTAFNRRIRPSEGRRGASSSGRTSLLADCTAAWRAPWPPLASGAPPVALSGTNERHESRGSSACSSACELLDGATARRPSSPSRVFQSTWIGNGVDKSELEWQASERATRFAAALAQSGRLVAISRTRCRVETGEMCECDLATEGCWGVTGMGFVPVPTLW